MSHLSHQHHTWAGGTHDSPRLVDLLDIMERTLPDEGQGLPRPDTGLKSIASDGPLQDLALWRKEIVNVNMKR